MNMKSLPRNSHFYAKHDRTTYLVLFSLRFFRIEILNGYSATDNSHRYISSNINVRYSVDQSFRRYFPYRGRIYNRFYSVDALIVTGDPIRTAHLRLLRQDRGRVSLLSLQREFLNDV